MASRRVRVLLGFVVGIVVPSLAEAPAPPPKSAPPENVTMAQGAERPVHIEHQLVVIRVTSGMARRAANTAAPRLAPRAQKRAVALARDERRGDALTKAVRAFVGNGRYRPEPFPRPGR
jgi:hypothetical protein